VNSGNSQKKGGAKKNTKSGKTPKEKTDSDGRLREQPKNTLKAEIYSPRNKLARSHKNSFPICKSTFCNKRQCTRVIDAIQLHFTRLFTGLHVVACGVYS
jgi:hypothetical protein